MAVPPGTVKFVTVGILPSSEEWNTGFWSIPPTPPANAGDMATLVAATADFVNPWLSSIRGSWGIGTSSSRLLGYWYPGGEFGDNAQFVGEAALDANAGTVGVTMPDQVALVHTLRTGISGRSFRGRMYVPCNGVALAANAQVNQATITAFVAPLAGMFNDMNSAGHTIVVASARQTLATPVSSVFVDSRLDIQRRRANKIVPSASGETAVIS